MNLHETLVDLGCICADEYRRNGVTNFVTRQLHHVTVRNVNGRPHRTEP